MHFAAVVVLLVVAMLLCLLPAAAETLTFVDVTPAQSAAALVNPGMGLYEGGTLNPDDLPAEAWYTPLIAIGYFRDDWCQLEPTPGADLNAYFDPIFDFWVKRLGKRVSFRVMSSNMHSGQEYVTPKWVFDTGVPGIRHKGLYRDSQLDPVFWDERYLQAQEAFIARLGKCLDGRPGLEFIDIGGIGEWGEMHLARWTQADLDASGYTETKYIAAYRRIIDAYARAFPHTRVFLNVGDYDTINDYAALRHMHFRQDGLNPAGPSADVGKRFYRPYSRRGVVCNYEFFAGIEEMKQRGWGITATFEKGLEDPISYLHLNLAGYGDLRDPSAELKQNVEAAARRIGFRFALTHVQHNQPLEVSGRSPGVLILRHTWKNLGVAPCYQSYALRWELLNAQGAVAAAGVTYPKRPTTLWWPGEEVSFQDTLETPSDLAPGKYGLAVTMFDPESPSTVIQLGIAGRDAAGRYGLGEVEAVRVASRQRVVYQEDFARGLGDWRAASGMTMGLAAGPNGAKALHVQGRQPGESWSYAQVATTLPVLPAHRYRLSCWMKVDQVQSAAPPYLKLGVNDQAGVWITNYNTPQYDAARLGTWQQLTTEFRVAPEASAGQIALEKGTDGEASAEVALAEPGARSAPLRKAVC